MGLSGLHCVFNLKAFILGAAVGEMMVDWFGVGAWVWTAKIKVGRVVTLAVPLGALEHCKV